MDEKLTELKRRVEADDPSALYEYSRLVRDSDPVEADKFVMLAAQLGEPHAAEQVGDVYLDRGDIPTAEQYFKLGAKAGILDCSVKLAVIELDRDEQAAVKELEDLAEIGIRSAADALAEYYRVNGNKKQAAYWRSLVK
ncbi:MAG: hypothetical protein HFJ21_03500 [Clostridia bacterium]|jgi:TPR repeat protein|nr:hypothetical protein [Clostridia bacterium]MCI9459511.1 hypothetical protein [Clostridia bacterium]